MSIEKILVIRFRRVGDAVLSGVLCSSLRKSFPHAQIDYVLNEGIAPLYSGHPDVDNVISFSNHDNANIFRYTNKVWRLMKGEHYDVILDTRSTILTLIFSLFSLSTPYRIGIRKYYNYFLHNHRVDNRKNIKSDVVERLLLLLKPLEQEAKIVYVKEFRLSITGQEKQSFRMYMEQQGIDFSKPVILAAVTARLSHKVWDKEKMKAVLQKMIDRYQSQIIFNYAGHEKEYAQELHQEMGFDPHVFLHIQADSLRELGAMTANCDFFFGNEGGPRHISQALEIPSYAIFPPGVSKSVWLPAGDQGRYQGISPDDVLPLEEQYRMTYSERFNLISIECVWSQVDQMMRHYLR